MDIHDDDLTTFEAEGADKTRLDMRMVVPSAEAKTLTEEKYGAIRGLHQTMDRLAQYVAKASRAND